MDAANFAAKLKELRIAAGLTQGELAEKAGLTKAGIANLEQGRREPAWSSVIALAQALGVDCRAFLQPPIADAPQGRGRPSKLATANESADQSDAANAKPAKKRGKRK